MGVRTGDRGMEAFNSCFTAGLHHYHSAELLRVDTPGSKSRGKHQG